jgi:C4-dicarboxylate-specific signal transduction histidine kinase
MSFTVIPAGPKPKPPVPLHRYMYRAIRDIEHITLTALTCPPTDSWSQYFLTNIVRAMRSAADELERAVELRHAEDRAAHQEKLAEIRERENDARYHK